MQFVVRFSQGVETMIQIQLRPEVETQLASEASAQGIALDRYIAEIVEAHSAAAYPVDEEQCQAVDEMLAFRHQYKATLGGLKLKDLIHEGHHF